MDCLGTFVTNFSIVGEKKSFPYQRFKDCALGYEIR